MRKERAMEVFNGPPEDLRRRLPKEQRAYELLDRLEIGYRRADHDPAMTMEACAAVDQAMDVVLCKNLLLCDRQCTRFYLLLMPADKPFKTSVLSKQIGSSRLSFAAGEYMERLLDICPGSLSVLGLMNDREKKVRLLMDRDLLDQEWFGCHPCVNTSSLRFSTGDLLDKLIPALGHELTLVDL